MFFTFVILLRSKSQTRPASLPPTKTEFFMLPQQTIWLNKTMAISFGQLTCFSLGNFAPKCSPVLALPLSPDYPDYMLKQDYVFFCCRFTLVFL